MKKITVKTRKEILEKAIKEGTCTGLWMMSLAPDSQKKLTKLGVNTVNNQTVRGLYTQFDCREFVLFLIDGIDVSNIHSDVKIWAFWEVVERPSKYGNISFDEGIWRGYIVENQST